MIEVIDCWLQKLLHDLRFERFFLSGKSRTTDAVGNSMAELSASELSPIPPFRHLRGVAPGTRIWTLGRKTCVATPTAGDGRGSNGTVVERWSVRESFGPSVRESCANSKGMIKRGVATVSTSQYKSILMV